MKKYMTPREIGEYYGETLADFAPDLPTCDNCLKYRPDNAECKACRKSGFKKICPDYERCGREMRWTKGWKNWDEWGPPWICPYCS